MTFDGRAVSLSPSVGNWSFDCESHYWIRSDEIDWVGGFNRTQIDAGRARRRRDIDAAISGRSKRRRVPESGKWLERMKGAPPKTPVTDAASAGSSVSCGILITDRMAAGRLTSAS